MLSLRFDYLDEVDDLGHLTFGLVVVRLNGLVTNFAKTKRLGGCNLVLFLLPIKGLFL